MESTIPFWGMLLQEPFLMYSSWGCLALAVIFGFNGAPFWLWALTTLVALAGFGVPLPLFGAAFCVAAIFVVKPLRRALVSSIVMKTMKALELIPKISETERTALEAGVVWAEAELFSGKPNFGKLMKEPYPELSPEEKKFLDNEVEQLCSMVDDYKMYRTKILPPEVFDFIKKKGFLGMIIPKKYGGLGFSHSAHSAIIQKVSSRSAAVGIYVMVPNSLGPAELLNHYGTEPQKNKYLPRLAKGEEIPCFGLTEPMAGSDAGSITAEGVLYKGDDGKLYIRLNWNKRWITLAAISTLIGLAFRLRDPQNLLGKGEDVGITCALIPSNLPGVVLGRRHDPLGVAFHNCPMQGKDVVVNAEDCIIGGIGGAGKGWEMLMECLSAGRGISLPAQSAGATKLAMRVTSAHGNLRKQFGVSIGKFEGVEEPLARIAGTTYFLEATRKYVLSALDQGIKPPVVTAIAKYNATELARKIVNDGMDVMGGAGISMGSRNVLAIPYIGIPISITVEGANILTRTLIVFGQGALRAHPYAFKEVNSIERNDLRGFDEAFWGHIGHIARNKVRALVLSFTRGYVAVVPGGSVTRRHFQRLAWASASFAILADLSMGLLGGKLKVKEKITGRFADILSWMFMATATLRRFEAEGCRKEDIPYLEYSMQIAFHNMQQAFDGIYANMDVPVIGFLFKHVVGWWSGMNKFSNEPSDALTHELANLMLQDNEQRERLTAGIYIPKDADQGLGRLEKALKAIHQEEGIDKKIRAAVKARTLARKKGPALLEEAVQKGVISAEEQRIYAEAEKLRYDAILVDDYSQEEYVSPHVGGSSLRIASNGGE